MAILPICHFTDDSALRQMAKRVPSIDSPVQRLIDDMVETMQQAKGVGLFTNLLGKLLTKKILSKR